MYKRTIPILLCFSVAWACSGTTDGKKAPRRAANRITANELNNAPAITPGQNLYDAIQYLRPQFLRSHGSRATGALPVVYLDNIRMGGLEALRQIFVSQVSEIRYLSASDATFKWGTGHPGGAILVTSGKKQ